MDNNCATKALLSAYKRLPKEAARLQRELNYSVSASVRSTGFNKVYALCDKLLELLSKKAACINLKVLVDRATSRISKRQRAILWYRHIEEESLEALALRLDVHESKLQREYASALNNLTFQFKALGYDEDRVRATLELL